MGSKGFTLVELMIAISVMSILGLAGLYGSVGSVQVANAALEARKVRDALTQARNTARFDLTCMKVDVLPNSLRITPYSSCTPVLAGPQPSQQVSLSSAVTLSALTGGSTLVFNQEGGTLSPNPVTLKLASSSGRSYQFTVMPAIGTVTME